MKKIFPRREFIRKATVAGIDNDTFQRVANDTKQGCPVSRAISGNVALSLDASLA